MILVACGGGIQHAENTDSAISAVEVANKGQYAELAESINKKPVVFNVVENVAYMQGTMDSTITHLVRNLIQYYPEVDTIVMQDVPGTIDFAAVLEAGRLVREACLTTVVPYMGRIASGGVHFFLSGCERIVESGGRVGIHQWKSGEFDKDGNMINTSVASDYVTTDSVHDKYLNYQAEMNIPEAFYWKMVSVPFEKTHYLSETELEIYHVVTQQAKTWGANYRLAMDPTSNAALGTARFYVQDGMAIMHGYITSQTAFDFQSMLQENPDVHTLEFGFVPGTLSPFFKDAIELGYAIRTQCLTTKIGQIGYVKYHALYAFLGGCLREFAEGGLLEFATPFGSLKLSDTKYEELEQDMIDYYHDMGISENFYSHQKSIPWNNPEILKETALLEFGIIY